MTIAPTIRKEVVAAWQAGKGRNQIAKDLCLSRGSVTNIIRAYRCGTAATALIPKTGQTLETPKHSHG